MHFLGTIVVVEIPYFSLSLSLSLGRRIEDIKILIKPDTALDYTDFLCFFVSFPRARN